MPTPLTKTLLLSLPLLASSSPFQLPSKSPTLNIVAHQDDDLFFQSPSLLHSLRSNAPHRTIFLTAGDAGNTSEYWESRYEGSRAAYAHMLNAPNRWVENEVSIPLEHMHTDKDTDAVSASVSVYKLATHPHVSLAFMHLPDGFPDGSGFPRTGNTSLQKLWKGEADRLTTVDGKASYSNETLVRALGSLVRDFRPEVVHVLDHQRGPEGGDHSDHFYGARYAREAVGWAFPSSSSSSFDFVEGKEDGEEDEKGKVRVAVIGYMGYPVIEEPVNVWGKDLEDKKEALYAYAKYDWMVCDSDEDCVGGYEQRWLVREVVI